MPEPTSVGRSSSAPRSRLSGVNRQTSSRPVGIGWSARSKDATGCRWLATFWDVSTACATAGWSVTVTNYRFLVLTGGASRRGSTASADGARSADGAFHLQLDEPVELEGGLHRQVPRDPRPPTPPPQS